MYILIYSFLITNKAGNEAIMDSNYFEKLPITKQKAL